MLEDIMMTTTMNYQEMYDTSMKKITTFYWAIWKKMWMIGSAYFILGWKYYKIKLSFHLISSFHITAINIWLAWQNLNIKKYLKKRKQEKFQK